MPHMPLDEAPVQIWNSGLGTPEGFVTADVGAIYLRLDGGPDTTLYIKEVGIDNLGWTAVAMGDVGTQLAALDTRLDTAEADIDTLQADVNTAESDIAALEAADVALDGRLDTAESDINALEAADTALDGRLDTAESDIDTLQAAVERTFLWYGGAVVTAGTNDRYANTPGQAVSPIGAAAIRVPSPVTGNLVAIHYMVTTAHTTNTVVITPRLNGVNQSGSTLTVTATSLVAYGAVTPVAVTRGDQLACHVNHTGATNLANLAVAFEIEF